MRIFALVCLAGALAVNVLANRLPLGGRTTGELSALYPNLFVPAGVTFSIWGVIYLLLMAWAVAQFLPGRRATALRIAPAFAVTSLLNAGWLFAWHFRQVGLSVAVMLALLLVLLRINHVLAESDGAPAKGAGILPRAAFGVYLGWISVATIANVTALLVALEWSGAGVPDAIWAAILVVVGGVAGALTVVRFRNPWVGWAVAWALLGIVLNRWDDHVGIAATALALMVLVAVFAVLAARAPHLEPARSRG
jgi:hypothetical protein